jgi:hypothetical protein
MGSFDHPAACFPAWQVTFGLRFFFALLDMRLIVAGNRCLEGWIALVSSIGAEILRLFGVRFRPRQRRSVQGGLQQFHVMHVGSAGDERQRDATRVDQQTSLAPIFFPDPWGSVPRIRWPMALFP